ncbi:transporter substrate-binding domain-containing protein [Jannaschia aquimarina]|uniref:HisJ protein n=1 Tax=Jannaschia aquimarina TaxID=935700 RepID=A0A0D1EJU6_9RHOB|nr:transporter substrate-binding domain-containing protein [Jannaschia aquimarina]KIT17824.1 Histidine-binding periplasmic protein precursor [Jannaschia aquimarina]SNS90684.1 amino acid ABC transporter substrate-binding protein, PAAT family [Jannaschia aquimarina]
MKKIVTLAAAAAISATAATADVKIGISAEAYPPFAEKDAAGNWVGWEMEIIDAVCAAMEEECEVVPVAWDGIIPALLSGRMDAIMASMSITEERMRTIDFSDKYYNTPAVIVAAKDSEISGDPASLDGKIVGVQVSTIHANYVEKHFEEQAEMKVYQTFDEHNQDLVAGRVDAVVGDSLAFQDFLSSDAGQAYEVKGELNDEEVFGPGVGVGLRQGEDELKERFNAAIRQIREDGTYDEISNRYFDFDIYGG